MILINLDQARGWQGDPSQSLHILYLGTPEMDGIDQDFGESEEYW